MGSEIGQLFLEIQIFMFRKDENRTLFEIVRPENLVQNVINRSKIRSPRFTLHRMTFIPLTIRFL